MAQAFAALTASPGARAFYDELRASGIEYNDALRRLANRLVGILRGCLKTRTLYDEATAWGHRENLPQSFRSGSTLKTPGMSFAPSWRDRRHQTPPADHVPGRDCAGGDQPAAGHR